RTVQENTMKLRIESKLPGASSLHSEVIEVVSLAHGARVLAEFVTQHFAGCAEQVDDFDWNTWGGEDTKTRLVYEDGTPVSLVNAGFEVVTRSMTALQSQLAAYRRIVPLGGEAFYRRLQDIESTGVAMAALVAKEIPPSQAVAVCDSLQS